MIKTIQVLLAIYHEIKVSEKKQKELDKLKASPLNYGILKELIDKAQHGVTIEVKLADGTVLSISPEVKPLKAPNYGENF